MRKIALLFILFCSKLFAVTVDTNNAAVLIDSGQNTSWQQMHMALAAIVSKKSGLSFDDVISSNQVDERFESVVLRKYFESIPAEFSPDQSWFNVVVDGEKMSRLMLEQGIPLWPERRNELFVWVVEELEDGQLINSSSDSEVNYWLSAWLKNKGIPASFYDYESEDLLSFQPTDVRYLNPDLIDYLNDNYDVAMSLLVFVKHTGSGYSYRMGLTKPSQETMIKNLKFLTLSSGLESLVTDVQLVMAEGQQVSADEFSLNTVSVIVNNINNAEQMLELINYFDNHALVQTFQIVNYKQAKLNLMVEIKVLPDTFIKFVENEHVLSHVPLDLGHTIVFSVAE